jgi:hypothetical protein
MYKKTNKRKNKVFRKNKTVKKGGRTKKQTKKEVIDKKLDLVIATLGRIDYDIELYDDILQKLNIKIEEVNRQILEFNDNQINFIDEIEELKNIINNSDPETKNEIMEQMKKLVETDKKNNEYLHASLDKYAKLIKIQKELIGYLQFLTIQKDILENTGNDELEPNIERIHNDVIEQSMAISNILVDSSISYL